MKNKIKTILLMALTISLFITTAFASEDIVYSVNGDSGQHSPNAIDLANIDDYLNSDAFKMLDESRQRSILNKLEIFTPSFARYTYPSSFQFNMIQFEQEEGYYCGPATVQQTLRWLNGGLTSTQSQPEIAKDIHTSEAGSVLFDMIEYINANNNYYCAYDIAKYPTKDDIKNILMYDCSSYIPAICRLRFDKGGNWAYNTNGHYMNANGYDFSGSSDGDMVYVTDPNITRVNSFSSGSYWVTLTELYNATTTHFAQEIAY